LEHENVNKFFNLLPLSSYDVLLHFKKWNNCLFMHVFGYVHLTSLFVTFNLNDWEAKTVKFVALFSLSFTLRLTEMSDRCL
jgi:hypothetical protein